MASISSIPVLYFPFSRPKYARQTFEAIKMAQPKKFYFYCDKARDGNEEELKNNNIIREYIKEVDWNCELKTWFRDENIGVYESILNAIDWFFEHEEMGIILEEDCLASLAFFDFCRQLLPKYKDDVRVWYIGGNNFIEEKYKGKYDYYFTPFAYQWGWATWRSRWKKTVRNGFDVNTIKEYRLYNQLYAHKKAASNAYNWLYKQADSNNTYKPVSWDYIFNMSMRCNGGFGICPKINLTTNIGVIGWNSSHHNKLIHNQKIPKEHTYLIKSHPPFVVSDYNYNNAFFKYILLKRKGSLIKMILNKLRNIVKNENNNTLWRNGIPFT